MNRKSLNTKWVRVPTVVFAIMLSLLLSGCGDPIRAKIVGSWEIKTADKVLRRFKDKSKSSGQGDSSQTDAQQGPGPARMSLEFKRGGAITTMTRMGSAEGEKRGSWEWLSYDEVKSVAKLKVILGLQETEHDVLFVDDDTIELVPPNLAGLNIKVQFQRKK